MKARDFIARTLRSLVGSMAYALESEELASRSGFLQSLDPRVKLIGLTSLILAVAVSRKLTLIAGTFALAVLLAGASRVPLRFLALRVWLPLLIFTVCISLPAVFVVPGTVIARVPKLSLSITEQGVRSALFLIMRTETAASLAVLLVSCTPWNRLLRALSMLRVPAVLVTIVGMTHRYIFLLLQTSLEMFESRQSRMVGRLGSAARRRMAAATAGVLMNKTLQVSEDVYLAMLSRGFAGDVHVLDEPRMGWRDGAILAAFLVLSVLTLWMGR